MSHSPGTRLGWYEIRDAIGAGGMGEVYRARDHKLNRDVAIKTLPPAFAADPARLSRFEREAQSLAALNHPNIAQIYGVHDDPPALVMELVDGDDLAVRLARGPLPVREALGFAIQMADALASAHERGIIHRDLKPANIKITDAGVVKVLDLGLAKASGSEGSAAAAGLENSPTFTSPALTQLGVILGTAAYMAPEQAKGKPVDRRADVWAFGGVVYEMLTGRRAFGGEDVTDVIAAIMRSEPDWSALPADTPPRIRRLLERCLEKDRAKRLDSMMAARLDIEEALASPDARPSRAAGSSPRWSWPVLAAVGAACAAAAALVTWVAVDRPPVTPVITRAQLTPVSPDALITDSFLSDLDISLDGRSIIYSARRGDSGPELHVRKLADDHGVPVPGTAGARGPALSADGQWISFNIGRDVKKVPVNGGSVESICRECAGGFRGGTWLSDGSFVFTSGGGSSGLQLVRPGASQPERLTEINREANERTHIFPRALPGDRGVLFAIQASGGDGQIAVYDLRSKTLRVLFRGGGTPQYSPTGHLLYAVAGTLFAIPFDLERLETSGVPIPVLKGLITKTSGGGSYAIAPDGTLAYLAGEPIVSRYVVSIQPPGGDPVELPLRWGTYVMGRFSPDGSEAVLDTRSEELDLHVWNFAARQLRRLTFAPTGDQYPVWTPGGHIVYSGNADGAYGVFRKNAAGAGLAERLTRHDVPLSPTSITPDGGTLIGHVSVRGRSLPFGLYTISMTGDHTPKPLMGAANYAFNAQLSPDGNWIAYETTESNRSEVVVHPYPNLLGGRWQISPQGGSQPVFSRSGDALYYRDLEGRLMRLPLRYSPQLTPGVATVVIASTFSPGPGRPYDVSDDGRILLMNEVSNESKPGSAPQLKLVLNWASELQRILTPSR